MSNIVVKIWQGVIFPILIYLIGNALALAIKEAVPRYVDMTMSLGIGAIFTIVILYIYAKRNKRLKIDTCFSSDKKKIDIRRFIYVIPIMFSFSIFYNVIVDMTKLSEIFPGGMKVSESLLDASPLVLVIVAIVLVPIVEEILFRGYIYKSISGYGGKVIASIVSAVLFAIAHGNVVQGIYAFICTFLFIYIYDSFDNIWVSILSHIIANLSGIFLGTSGIYRTTMPFMHKILLIIICIALFFMSIYRFKTYNTMEAKYE